tara:strand:- start:32 stop:535 length:504 start_codon:yes stop_codon:yes gene_type:complete
MDVMTVGIAIKSAQTAFNFIKRGIDTGKEVQDMGQAFGKLFESWNEINQRDIENKNPPVLRKLTAQKSITAEALEIVLAKKKALDQRKQLYDILGKDTWSELVREEKLIKKAREESIYQARRFRQKVVDGICIVIGCIVIATIIFGGAYWLMTFHDEPKSPVISLLI